MTITISKADATALLAGTAVTIQLATAVTPPAPPAPVPPIAGAYIIYQNGKYNWPGDYNSGAVSDYANADGNAQAPSTKCLKLSITSPWGEWLPYSHANPGPFLDISKVCNGGPATKLSFKLKATKPNQVVSLYCISAGDKPPPSSIPGYVSAAGVFPVGVWVTQTVELASLGLGPTQSFSGNMLYKFGVQDKTGLASNVLYIDDVVLLP